MKKHFRKIGKNILVLAMVGTMFGAQAMTAGAVSDTPKEKFTQSGVGYTAKTYKINKNKYDTVNGVARIMNGSFFLSGKKGHWVASGANNGTSAYCSFGRDGSRDNVKKMKMLHYGLTEATKGVDSKATVAFYW
ncbi:MAG: hypothetical protein K6G62_06125 [Eubacterium sp.]|nr:hypothetical protein [Eubacterium sp.]